MIKRTLLTAIVMVGGAAHAADADFTLVNKTGYPIEQVFISPSKKNNWGTDKLGKYQLSNGQSKKFKFGDTKHCLQDIKVVFTDEDEAEWEEFDLCELNKITLKYNRKTGDVSADSE